MSTTTVPDDDLGAPAGGSAAAPEPAERESYGRGAKILTVGIGATGVLTAVYFVITSHVLTPIEAKRVDLLWSIMWVVISVIYRPIEQLLSRTIAHRRAHGLGRHPLRAAILIQAAFGASFLVVALAFHHKLRDDAFDGSTALYLVLLIGIAFYAVSYFARGWLAGHQHFKLYGGLVFMESASRCVFALAVALGIAHGQTAVAVGIAVAPFVSLVVLPIAFGLRGSHPTERGEKLENSTRESTSFAVSVAGIMLAEQALLNAAVITVEVSSRDKILAGIVFNVLLIARAPLQLFQAIQTSLLPHLAKLEARKGHDDFGRVVRLLVGGIAALTAAVTVGLLAIGPFVMSHVFGQHFQYGRFGLAAVGIGMGLHLTAGTLNQAALARGQARLSSVAWLVCAGGFLLWTVIPVVGNVLLRVEVGYAGATAVLSVLLYVIYRAGRDVRLPSYAPSERPLIAEPAGANQST
jgi:O-antigen/teichoic acid export membrane protein